MSATPTKPSDDAVPFPQRYWWLKRLLPAGALVLAALFGLRLWWGWYAHRLLQAEVDKYLAAGGPIYPEDFACEPVPDEENAAWLYAKAFTAINLSPAEVETLHEASLHDDTRKRLAPDLERILAANVEALALVRQARSQPGLNWGTRSYRPEIFNVSFGAPRRILNLLSARAGAAYDRGDHREWVERLQDILSLARATSEHPYGVGLMMAIVFDDVLCRQIETFAPNLHVGARTDRDPSGSTLADPAFVRDVIGILVDGEYIRERMIRELRSERMQHVDLFASILGVRLSESPFLGALRQRPVYDFLMRPVYQLDAVRCLRDATTLVNSLQAGQPPPSLDEGLIRQLAQSATPAMNRLLRPTSHGAVSSGVADNQNLVRVYRAIANRRMAGTALAIRLFEIDHGHRPNSLEELVPGYLQSIPGDPLTLDGKSLGYLPNAESPVLYSVGDDGIDNGGKSGRDYVFFLNGDRPIQPRKPRNAPQRE